MIVVYAIGYSCAIAAGAAPPAFNEKDENMPTKETSVQRLRYQYYQEEDAWIGWLEDYPDYRTQGQSLAELEENLRDLFAELTSGAIPCVLHTGELVIQ